MVRVCKASTSCSYMHPVESYEEEIKMSEDKNGREKSETTPPHDPLMWIT